MNARFKPKPHMSLLARKTVMYWLLLEEVQAGAAAATHW